MIAYIIIFIFIGIGASLISKKLIFSEKNVATLTFYLLGTFGSLVGGIATLLILAYGRSVDRSYGFEYVQGYPHQNTNWLSILISVMISLTFLIGYKLYLNRNNDW